MSKFSDHKGVCGIYMMYRQPAEKSSEGKTVGSQQKIIPNPNLVWLDISSQGNCINLGKVPFYQTVSIKFDICNGNYTQVAYNIIQYDKNIVSLAFSEIIVDPRYTKELKATLIIKNPKFNGESKKLEHWQTIIKFEPRSIS